MNRISGVLLFVGAGVAVSLTACVSVVMPEVASNSRFQTLTFAGQLVMETDTGTGEMCRAMSSNLVRLNPDARNAISCNAIASTSPNLRVKATIREETLGITFPVRFSTRELCRKTLETPGTNGEKYLVVSPCSE